MEGFGGALPPYVAEWMAEVREAGGKVTRPCPANAEQAEAHHRELEERRAVARAVRNAKIAERLQRVSVALGTSPKVDLDCESMKLWKLLLQVAIRRGVEMDDVLSDRRGAEIVFARQEYFYLARMETKHNYPAIGRVCGGRDQSTVRHGIIAHCKRNELPLPPDVKPKRSRG